MTKTLTTTLLICIALFFTRCQKELSNYGNNDGPVTVTPAPITAHLQGTVFDENGDPAAGATIAVGSKTMMTNADGFFRIEDAPLDKKASLVKASLSGYFQAYRTFQATEGENLVIIKLIKKTLAGTVSSGAGGTVSLTNGSKIILPAAAVVKASDNSSYTGAIRVYAAYIDPTANDIRETVPGSFMADDKDGRRVTLKSFGMMAVELESEAGEKLQISTGKKATLQMPVPPTLSGSAPSSIPLWFVDEKTGIWKEEGSAQKSGNIYSGEVSHFSFWNCDISAPAINISLRLKNADGSPLAFTVVDIGSPSTGSAHGVTGATGEVNGLIPANVPLTLRILSTPCSEYVADREIGPFNSDVVLEIDDLDLPNSFKIEGRAITCTGNAVTDGYVLINNSRFIVMYELGNDGRFGANLITCLNAQGTISLKIADRTSGQESGFINVPTGTSINLNDVAACGTSSAEFMNYSIDNGPITNIGSNSADSLYARAWPGAQGTFNLNTRINSWSASGNSAINMWLKNNTTSGEVADLVVNGEQATIVSVMQASFTTYAAAPGEFFEGSISGQYTLGGAPHVYTFTASFRIRRES